MPRHPLMTRCIRLFFGLDTNSKPQRRQNFGVTLSCTESRLFPAPTPSTTSVRFVTARWHMKVASSRSPRLSSYLALAPVSWDADWTGHVLASSSYIQCVAIIILGLYLSRISLNYSSISVIWCLKLPYCALQRVSSLQSSLNLLPYPVSTTFWRPV